MRLLVDTSLLGRLANTDDLSHAPAIAAVIELRRRYSKNATVDAEAGHFHLVLIGGRLIQPHHQPLLRLAISEMHQGRSGVCRQIVDARFHDRPSLAAYGPGATL